MSSGVTGVAANRAWLAISALWGIAEATLFFIVPDVLLSFVGVRHGARRGVTAGICAALGAGAGGAAMALWSQQDFESARNAVLTVPAVSESMVLRADASMARNWFLATLTGPFSATPFKVFAVLAPHHGVSPTAFAAAGVVARLPRFLVVPCLGAWLARRFRNEPDRRKLRIGIAAFWSLFYLLFFWWMPN